MKRIITTLTIVLFVALTAFGLRTNFSAVPAVQAQELEHNQHSFTRSRPCSRRTARGRYSVTIQGSLVTPSPAPLAALGAFEVDYMGNITGSDTASFGGQIIPRTYTGTLTVDADCTASARLTVQTGTPGLVVNLKGMIVEEGREIHFIETDPGTIITGVAKRQ